MNTGKISSANAKLTDTSMGVLSLEETAKGQTVEQIFEKHPPAEPVKSNYITSCSEDTIPFHSSTFDQINAQKIRKAAMTTNSTLGTSGLDAYEWRPMLTHFGQHSVEISKTLAKIAQKISTEILSHELLEPYNVCPLIPLDKDPGVRPIGIGEVIRRIICRTTTKSLKSELMILGLNFNYALAKKMASNKQFMRLGSITRTQIPMQYY